MHMRDNAQECLFPVWTCGCLASMVCGAHRYVVATTHMQTCHMYEGRRRTYCSTWSLHPRNHCALTFPLTHFAHLYLSLAQVPISPPSPPLSCLLPSKPSPLERRNCFRTPHIVLVMCAPCLENKAPDSHPRLPPLLLMSCKDWRARSVHE